MTAEQLAQAWTRISRQHLALGAACGCGIGFSISASDLEEDLCDYIEELAVRERRQDVSNLLADLRRNISGRWALASLLAALRADVAADTTDFLLHRLTESLSSLDQAHERRTFTCVA